MDSTERNLITTSDNTAPPKSVLARGLTVLDAVGSAAEPLRLYEIADATGLARPTVYRLVKELTTWGALERTEYSTFRLGHRLSELGSRVPAARALRDLAVPYMEDLHTVTTGVAHLAVLEGTDVLHIEQIAAHDPGPSLSRVGGRTPAYRTGVGKAILAFSSDVSVMRTILRGLEPNNGNNVVVPQLLIGELREIRRVGFAIDREDTEDEIAYAAAPVLDHRGVSIAAVSITDGASSIHIDAVTLAVRICARGISRAYQAQSSSL